MATIFSKNAGDFPGLDPSPGFPEPNTLAWELDNDATLSASTIVVDGEIEVRFTDGDYTASISFLKAAVPTPFLDLTGPEQAAVEAVLAAHEGKAITADQQSIDQPSAVPTPGGAAYTDVASFVTLPLVAGTYEFEFKSNAKLDAAPATLGTSRLQHQIEFTDGQGATNIRAQHTTLTQYNDAVCMGRTFTARAGEVVTIVYQVKGSAVGIDGQVNRVVAYVRPA